MKTLIFIYFLHQFFLQNTLSSLVVHNALAAADHLVLGVVKVWGAGHVTITEATLTDSEGKPHPLTLDHNLETQVSRSVKCSSFRFNDCFNLLQRSFLNKCNFKPAAFIFLSFLLILSTGADYRCHTKVVSSPSSFYYKLEDQQLKAIFVFHS